MNLHSLAIRVMGAMLAVLLITLSVAYWLFRQPATPEENPVVRLSPEELRASFQSHEKQARRSYHGKPLEIIGVVTSILHRSVPGQNATTHIWNIELADHKENRAFVWATFQQQRPDVREGDLVVVRGVLDTEPLEQSQQVRLTQPRIVRREVSSAR